MNDSDLVTVGHFNARIEPLEKGVAFIIEELKNMREENREIYRVREQLYSNDVRQERQIVDLQERVHALEIAK